MPWIKNAMTQIKGATRSKKATREGEEVIPGVRGSEISQTML
jgi:hypothetical protein